MTLPEHEAITGRTTPTLWQQAQRRFLELATQEPARRRDALARLEAEDPRLRWAVEQLLEHDQSDDFLEVPWSPAPTTADSEGGQDAEPADEVWLGARVGPYRLVRELGRGGSGVVFLAERDDAEFEHRVAVKLLGHSPDPTAAERFRRERQILARLEHPHIAGLFGGGKTPNGRQYVLMEWIDGEPITRYCDQRRLSVEQRLELFCAVCAGVQHAHQSLVVHRDIKPSNILVTADGQPKLLDFGIAKRLDPAQADETGELTRWMTPSYASPEQIYGRRVTTASDVYSLGVLLYELLCGLRPHEVEPVAVKADAASIWPPPSHAWRPTRDEELSAFQAEASAARASTPTTLRRQLLGDLDHIVMRALHADPQRRWVSAEQLAADVRRYLRGEPVTARRGGMLYHSLKFIRRNRISVAVAAGLSALVLTFAVLAAWQARQSAEQRDRAQREQIKAETVAATLGDLFRLMRPMAGREYSSEFGKEILDESRSKIHREFADQPVLQAALLLSLGDVYLDLQYLDEADECLEQAYSLLREHAEPGSEEIAGTLGQLGRLRTEQGSYEEAEQHLLQALDLHRRRGPEGESSASTVMLWLGRRARHAGDLEQAERWYRESIELEQRLGRGDSRSMAGRFNELGLVLRDQDRPEEAEAAYRRALAVYGRHGAADSLNVASLHNNLAGLAFSRGDWQTSAEGYREALAIWRQVRGNESPEVQAIVANLGIVLFFAGELEEAEPLLRESLELQRQRLGASHPHVALGLSNLGGLLREMQRLDEARELLREALAIRRDVLAAEHPHIAASLQLLGLIELESRRPRAAAPLFEEALVINLASRGEAHRETGVSRLNLVKLALAEKRPEDALRHLDEVEVVFVEALPEGHWRLAEAASLRGQALADLGRRDEARALLTESLQRLREGRGEKSLVVRQAQARLAAFGSAADD